MRRCTSSLFCAKYKCVGCVVVITTGRSTCSSILTPHCGTHPLECEKQWLSCRTGEQCGNIAVGFKPYKIIKVPLRFPFNFSITFLKTKHPHNCQSD